MVKFEHDLLKYGKLALSSGKKLILVPIIRGQEIKWKIYLQTLVNEGTQEIDIED